MEEALLGRGLADRAQAGRLDRAFLRRGGRRSCFSSAYAVASRRLPVRAPGDNSAADPLFAAPLLPTPRPLAAAGRRRDRPARNKFKAYAIGYFPIDIAEVRTEQGRLYLFVAIDRTSKSAFIQLHEKATRRVAGEFLRSLIAAVPYKVHTVLTDNGTHFTSPGNTCSAASEIRLAMDNGEIFMAHSFEYACAQNYIDHRLTKPKHPWTNGQVERMNRTLKDATVKRFYSETHDQLRLHLDQFVAAYNFARRLKTLKGLTPYQFICNAWTKDPHPVSLAPAHQPPGPNS